MFASVVLSRYFLEKKSKIYDETEATLSATSHILSMTSSHSDVAAAAIATIDN